MATKAMPRPKKKGLHFCRPLKCIRSKIPWQELPMTAEECAELFAITADHFLRTVACKPTFPVRLTRKPATWKAGEVIEWRDENRFG